MNTQKREAEAITEPAESQGKNVHDLIAGKRQQRNEQENYVKNYTNKKI